MKESGGRGSWGAALLLLLAFLGLSVGLKITSDEPTTIEQGQGETVKLPCQFTLSPDDKGPLDIEWSLLPPDPQLSEQVILFFSGDRVYDNYYDEMKGRVHFSSNDPKSGDASITIRDLKNGDTGIYQCKVKKAPGLQSRKITLSVIAKPSTPKCSVDGIQEVGKELRLKCTSAEGTPPVTYTWEKIKGGNVLPATASMDITTGLLIVKNASQECSGQYRCVAENRVGSSECTVFLSVVHAANKVGVIVGAVIGVLLGLSVIALIIWCCCRQRKEKKYEKEVAHEIKEDVPPPKSRASTARSYIGSNRSSLGSFSPSNMEYHPKAQYNHVASEDFDPPPRHTPNPPPSKFVSGEDGSYELNSMSVV
ncbi:coxsackievirus and adenovirus receptor homolog isoform X2 [Latimeria chalumnae]|uniref:coxsackievirus and adenovirus receptor homolog isoform X2 n=1 Tax=Latimeria chalumnae TaxID=7897 RepID=UPI00313B0229